MYNFWLDLGRGFVYGFEVFLAANFADELLGELFYLPYGRIWGSRWSYLHELLEGCYLPYGSLCIRVCGSFLRAENVWGVLFLAFAISALLFW